jgi:hypothetical protein
VGPNQTGAFQPERSRSGVFPERLDLTPWLTTPTLYAFMVTFKQKRGKIDVVLGFGAV